MKELYIERRRKLAELMEKNSMLISFSGEEKHKTCDLNYDFEVERNFYYLTGLDEPQAILVIIKTDYFTREFLYVRRMSKGEEIVTGETKPVSYYQEMIGIQEIGYKEDFEADLPTRFGVFGLSTVYFCGSQPVLMASPSLEGLFAERIQRCIPGVTVKNLCGEIKKMRRIKSDKEIAMMKKAADLTAKGIEALVRDVRPGVYEYQLEADFEHAIKYHGARGTSFHTIAASGKNSFTIHYEKNQDMLQSGDLLLIDLGADYHYYCSDVSRVYPVDGTFTEEQAYWYNVCLKAQEMIINNMRPNASIDESGIEATDYVAEELFKAGLIPSKEAAGNIFQNNFASIGGPNHEIGIDTHENFSTPKEKGDVFRPGMAYAVEPGIYLKDLNIGIRVEDVVVVTEEGPLVLTADIPKTVEEVEAFMSRLQTERK